MRHNEAPRTRLFRGSPILMQPDKDVTAMKIVICDDDAKTVETVNALVEEYAALRSLRWDVAVYTSGPAMLRELPEADIYLLDIIMPDADGITLGTRLRERYRDAVILYLTSSREFAVDAFAVHAFSYLIKPVERRRLFDELDACTERREKRYCAVEVRHGDSSVTETVALDDVVSVEYFNHRLIYRLAGGRELVTGYKRGSFESIAEPFHISPCFLKISVSYIVNLRHIRELRGDSFCMSDGTSFRISRKFTEAKKKYLDFILGV